MSEHPDTKVRSDLQDIIAAKISLREELRAEFRGLVDAVKGVSDARYDGVKTALDHLEEELSRRFVETDRFYQQQGESFTKSLNEADLRHQQRFEAQQRALVDALIAAEKAVNTALVSADRAVIKAETAAEKRFESVNEFRSTLSDQAATFLPRSEAEARFSANADKISSFSDMTPRSEHTQLAENIRRVELEMRNIAAISVRREDLVPITTDIVKLRDAAAVSGGKSQVWAIVGSAALSIIAMIVVVFTSLHQPASSNNPLIGADTNRVTDIISQMNAANAAQNQRMDALSARLNQLTPDLPLSNPSIK